MSNNEMVSVPLNVLAAYLEDDSSRMDDGDSCWEILTRCVDAAEKDPDGQHQGEPAAALAKRQK